jgi:hypothetical protein
MTWTDRWTLTDYEAYLERRQQLRLAQERSSPSPASGETDERENALLARVRRVALDQGFHFYHTHNSRRSDKGYPDCTLVKPGRLLFAELKDRTSKPTHAQAIWLDLLRHSVPGVEVYLWRPQDFGDIHDILGRK